MIFHFFQNQCELIDTNSFCHSLQNNLKEQNNITTQSSILLCLLTIKPNQSHLLAMLMDNALLENHEDIQSCIGSELANRVIRNELALSEVFPLIQKSDPLLQTLEDESLKNSETISPFELAQNVLSQICKALGENILDLVSKKLEEKTDFSLSLLHCLSPHLVSGIHQKVFCSILILMISF